MLQQSPHSSQLQSMLRGMLLSVSAILLYKTPSTQSKTLRQVTRSQESKQSVENPEMTQILVLSVRDFKITNGNAKESNGQGVLQV